MEKKVKGYWKNMFASEEVYKWTCLKWTAINQRTVNGAYVGGTMSSTNRQHKSYLAKHIRLEMTKEDFFRWCASNEDMVLGMIVDGARPSIDRICEECTYSTSNIQIIPLIDNITKHKIKSNNRASKLQYTLRNRKMYITDHISYDYKKLVVDYYLTNYPLRFVVDCINDGLIDDYREYVTDNTTYNDEVITMLDNKIAEIKRIKEVEAKIQSARVAKIEALKAVKDAEDKRKADKKWAKSMPEYDAWTKEYNKIRPDLVKIGTSVQKAVIRALKEKYNRN